MEDKCYIAPGGWFALRYPAQWCEFEDSEGCFLFYNPDKWDGNFRVSVFKDASDTYADDVMEDELKHNPSARRVIVGPWNCVYSNEDIVEEGQTYTMHLWLLGKKDTYAECSFTVSKGESEKKAEEVIASLELRDLHANYPKAVIPVRVLEINRINESFDWAVSQIKKVLKKDFHSSEQDIPLIQQIVSQKAFGNKKPEEALAAFGVAFGTILVNEMDGFDWVTVIDGRKEYPALRFADKDVVVEVETLAKPTAQFPDLKNLFSQLKEQIESLL